MALNARLALAIAAVFGLAVAAAVLYHHPPGQSWVTPPCLMHKLTGLHCPGCGSTRATYALLHGDFAGALRKNLLFIAALPFLGWWGLASAWRWTRGLPAQQNRLLYRPWFGFLVVGAVFLFVVLRNLPWPPFSWLAPH